jgi:hypothetical protein
MGRWGDGEMGREFFIPHLTLDTSSTSELLKF